MKESCIEEALFSLLLPVFAALHTHLASVVLGSILRRLGTPILGIQAMQSMDAVIHQVGCYLLSHNLCYQTVILNRP